MRQSNLTDLSSLTPGTIVRNVGSGQVYIVTGNYGKRVTAVRTVDITNPPEWEVVTPAQEDAVPDRLDKY